MSDVEALMLEVRLILNIGHVIGFALRTCMYCCRNQLLFLTNCLMTRCTSQNRRDDFQLLYIEWPAPYWVRDIVQGGTYLGSESQIKRRERW